MLSARIEFPSTLSQRLWSWIWIWQNKTCPPLSTSGRIWSQYLYRELSRHENWICTCHVSCTCPGLLHTRVSPGHISIKSVKSDIHFQFSFKEFRSSILLYNLKRMSNCFLQGLLFQYSILLLRGWKIALLLVWCVTSEGRNIYTKQTIEQCPPVQTPDSPITWSVCCVSPLSEC